MSGRGGEDGRGFAGSAARLAGFAGAVLGWSPDAFWRATPAELAAVVRAASGGGEAAAMPPDAATLARMREAFPDG
ncbi:phage tail assembly chaperone [Sphingomonas sp. A2-49]|uniref:phage tail assembly chaperone n=1 Tax=Sphingomonas sp. A2-49 TaxID=1391375 RepID=UPI0021D0B180|nr:phage tail assembly chaperone [Sphingomonas sp. A2-49]MCU6455862.1 phage tail assembly chaperone [Sphingomonas sp. A2-49]